MLIHKGIRGIVYCASHSMEPLWAADGIEYATLISSPAIEPSKTITSQLPTITEFIRVNSPALVVSSSAALRAVVAAARISQSTGLSAAEALAQLEGAGVEVEMTAADRAELESFCASQTLSTPKSAPGQSRAFPPPPVALPAATVAGGKARKRERDEPAAPALPSIPSPLTKSVKQSAEPEVEPLYQKPLPARPAASVGRATGRKAVAA